MSDAPVFALKVDEIVPNHGPKGTAVRFVILGTQLKGAKVTFSEQGGSTSSDATDVTYSTCSTGDWIAGDTPSWTKSGEVDVTVTPPSGVPQPLTFTFD